MAFVWETVGLVALRDRLQVRLLPALSLVGIQNLKTDRERESPVKNICTTMCISEAEQSFTQFDIRLNAKMKNLEKSPGQEEASKPGISLESPPSQPGTRLLV